MAGVLSNARARAASPSAPAFNPSPAAAENTQQRRRWQPPVADDDSLASFSKIDIFRGFPFEIGVFVGGLVGLPVSLLGVLAYVCTAPPRNMLCLVKHLVLLLARSLLHAALIAALLAGMYALVAGSSGFNLPKPSIEYLNLKSYSNLPQEHLAALIFSLLFAAQYVFPVFRRLFNVFLLALLASTLHPTFVAHLLARCAAFASFVWASVGDAASLAADCLPDLAAALLALLIVSYIANIVLTLLHYLLWLIFLPPRFVAGLLYGLTSSFAYWLFAVTLTYHPSHSW
jgi:hypothetical protein